MLTIRRRQFLILERASLELWLVNHLNKHFPELRQSLPGGHFRDFVRDGVVRANARGFKSSSEIANWMNLMALLGPKFDEDPRYPWVAPILTGDGLPAIKIHNLLDAAEEQVWGTGEDVDEEEDSERDDSDSEDDDEESGDDDTDSEDDKE